jgi:hypothetical protein
MVEYQSQKISCIGMRYGRAHFEEQNNNTSYDQKLNRSIAASIQKYVAKNEKELI